MLFILIYMEETKCLIDGKTFSNGGVMARHLKKEYGLTYKEYYHKYIIKTDDVPACKCGCGQEMKWKSSNYAEYAKGHYSRVHNNWGHNKDAIERSAETRRQQYKNGERQVWNDGLKKGDHPSVDKYGDGRSKAFTQKVKKQYSQQMKKSWEDGKIVPLTGKDHPQWKGGSSTIQVIARGNKRLYDEWKFPILKRDDFKCTKCGSSDKLHVHHDDIEFCDIIQIIMLENKRLAESDNYDDKKLLADKVIDYHTEKNVSGITLCYECHNELHPSLNFG